MDDVKTKAYLILFKKLAIIKSKISNFQMSIILFIQSNYYLKISVNY